MARSLITVVETSAYLTMGTDIMDEGERTAVVDMIAADPQSGDLIQDTGVCEK